MATLVASVLVIAASTGVSLSYDETSIDVPVHELGSRVHLVGNLGRRLHEVVTVSGEWIDNPARSGQSKPTLDLLFRVSSVDGKSLKTPVIFRESQLWDLRDEKERKQVPRIGAKWELRCYEVLRENGIPLKAYEEMKLSHSPANVERYETLIKFYRCSETSVK